MEVLRTSFGRPHDDSRPRTHWVLSFFVRLLKFLIKFLILNAANFIFVESLEFLVCPKENGAKSASKHQFQYAKTISN